MLDRRINELLHLRKRDNRIHLAVNLRLLHPPNRAVEVYVFPAGQLSVKASAYLQEGTQPAVNFCKAGGWLGNARENLEQRAFPGAIAANNADHLTLLDLKG